MIRKDGMTLMDIVEDIVSFGRKNGADEMEVSIIQSSDFNVDIRLGRIENLVQAGLRFLSLKIINDKKTAYATSSDFSPDTLHSLVKNTIKRTSYAQPDEFSGLPSLPQKETDIHSLALYDPEIPMLDLDRKITLAKETERIALTEKKITNSHGASFETKDIQTVLANSKGFLHEYKETFCALSLGLQAGETDSRVEDYWFSTGRHFKDIEPPEKIAEKAVARTLRQINPRKIKTQYVPVLFEPMMTSWLLGFLFACVSGVAIYQKASFLVDRLGEQIGNEKITVYDDGLIPGKLGTRPYDAEGIPAQKTTVIEKGRLRNYLCHTYAGRKLKLKSTANAEGAGVGPTNFYLQAGKDSPSSMISSLEKGMILVRTLGHGLNPLTGDISRGAFGLWVERGEVCYPVSEITISGNLEEFLQNVEAVGNDLEFRTSVCGPTVLLGKVMVSGA